jgi:hypothetical protein
MFWKKQDKNLELLKNVLSNPTAQDEFLGVSPLSLPTPDQIRTDASRILAYTKEDNYKLFAKEAWSKALTSLAVILDDKATNEQVTFHRGAMKATLDLLSLSAQARLIKEQIEKEQAENASLQRYQ